MIATDEMEWKEAWLGMFQHKVVLESWDPGTKFAPKAFDIKSDFVYFFFHVIMNIAHVSSLVCLKLNPGGGRVLLPIYFQFKPTK